MTVGVLVPAAGLGVRLGPGPPKALRLLQGESLLLHSVRGLRQVPDVGPVVVAAPESDVEATQTMLARYDVTVVPGAGSRSGSVAAALAALPPGVDLVLVHDAARCLTPWQVFAAVVRALRDGAAAAVPVLPVYDTVKRVAGSRVVETVPREHLRAAQTPQGFRRAVLQEAHDRSGDLHTDDAGMVEALGYEVVTVPGSEESFKVTRPIDLLLAEAVLRGRG